MRDNKTNKINKNNKIRKTSEEIKGKILSQLKEKPVSAEQLRKNIDSNWSTIKNYLDELKNQGEVREISLRNNLKYYIRSDYPAFYGLPLDKTIINNGLFLLKTIVETWKKENNELINKTTMQKIAVEIAQKNEKFNLPVLKFHYGKTLPVSLNPSNYSFLIEEYKVRSPENSKEIKEQVLIEVKKGGHVNKAWKEKIKQYKKHKDMKIYLLSDELSYQILKGKKDDKYLLDLFSKIMLEIPSSNEYSYIFEKYSDFLNAVTFIFHTKEFQNPKERENLLKEILDTFNSIWNLLTIEFYFNGFKALINKDFGELQETIKQTKIDFFLFTIEDKLSNLLDYKKSLTPKEIELNKEEKKMLNILLEGADEE